MVNKKGQVEMIGLVLFVIILVIGLLFYVKFAVLKDNGPKEDTALKQAYATNLMGAVLNVKVCESAPVKIDEGIVACFNGEQICEQEACSYVKSQINQITADLKLKNYGNYSIWITKGDENRTISSECKTGILTHTTLVAANRAHYKTYFRLC